MEIDFQNLLWIFHCICTFFRFEFYGASVIEIVWDLCNTETKLTLHQLNIQWVIVVLKPSVHVLGKIYLQQKRYMGVNKNWMNDYDIL